MQQIDALNELPKDKRPTDEIIWEGTPDDMEEWLDKVMDRKEQTNVDILIKDIEE